MQSVFYQQDPPAAALFGQKGLLAASPLEMQRLWLQVLEEVGEQAVAHSTHVASLIFLSYSTEGSSLENTAAHGFFGDQWGLSVLHASSLQPR